MVAKTILNNLKLQTISRKWIELDKNDNSFQVLKFKDQVIAADFLAQQLSNSEDVPVIVNANNYGLDTSFITFNSSLSGSEINNANPQITQLFKLVSTLLFTKVNPNNLLSLLNLPALPFSKNLAKKLSKVLINSGGTGNEAWLKSIADFKKAIDKENTNWKEKLKAVAFYLERNRVDELSKKDIIDVYRDIATWCGKRISFEGKETTKIQFYNLQELSKSFINTIESLDQDTFSLKSLNQAIDKVYDPISIPVYNKEKGSYTVLAQPTQLYDTTDNLIWVDFYNTELSAKFSSFLMQSEIEELKKQDGILLWSKENQIQLQLNNNLKGLLKTNNRVCLFVAEKTNAEKTTEHPLYTQLGAIITNFEDFLFDFSFDTNTWTNNYWKQPELITPEFISLPKVNDYLHINKASLLNKRKTESYSSINELIQYPMDWVMKYQARITENGLGTIDELITLKGNLSHIIFQTLLESEKQNKINFETADINKEIDVLLKQFTPQIAASFYLEENKFEFIQFTNQLKKSFKILLDIINNNNLIYHAYEYSASGKIDAINFSGNIDLLFHKGNTPIIIDLKWTFQSKKYANILEDEKSIQLSIYAKLLNNTKAATGYFLISHGLLFTTSRLISEGKGVEIIPLKEDAHYVNDRILKRTINSYNYRWNELEKGTIELYEDQRIDNIAYANSTEEEDLIPLDLKTDTKLKKVNPYSVYGLFKGEVK